MTRLLYRLARVGRDVLSLRSPLKFAKRQVRKPLIKWAMRIIFQATLPGQSFSNRFWARSFPNLPKVRFPFFPGFPVRAANPPIPLVRLPPLF